MGRIYLVRHGETEWNRQQRSQGCSNDIALSKEGILQAEAAGEKLKDEKIDMVFSSTLLRAHQTAVIIAKHHNVEVIKCSEFLEINFGIWEGMVFSDIKAKHADTYNLWRNTPHLAKIPGGESILVLKERSMAKLFEIVKAYPDKNILIVSDGISLKVIITVIMGMDPGSLHRIRQDNTAINIFDYDHENNVFDCITLNNTCHLKDIEGLAAKSFEMK